MTTTLALCILTYSWCYSYFVCTRHAPSILFTIRTYSGRSGRVWPNTRRGGAMGLLLFTVCAYGLVFVFRLKSTSTLKHVRSFRRTVKELIVCLIDKCINLLFTCFLFNLSPDPIIFWYWLYYTLPIHINNSICSILNRSLYSKKCNCKYIENE